MRWMFNAGNPGCELTERRDFYRVAAPGSEILNLRPTGSWAITDMRTCGSVFPVATRLHPALAPGR
ncbi:hypothetical protein [Nocardia africana]